MLPLPSTLLYKEILPFCPFLNLSESKLRLEITLFRLHNELYKIFHERFQKAMDQPSLVPLHPPSTWLWTLRRENDLFLEVQFVSKPKASFFKIIEFLAITY